MGKIKDVYNELKGAGKAITNAGKIIASASIVQSIVGERKDDKRREELHQLELKEKEVKIEKIKNSNKYSIYAVVTEKEFEKVVKKVRNNFKEISYINIESYEIFGNYSYGLLKKTNNFTINLSGFTLDSQLFTIEKSDKNDDLPDKFCKEIVLDLLQIYDNKNIKFEEKKEIIKNKINKENVQTIICNNCGVSLISGVKFCSECGAKVEVKNKFCSECGTKLLPGVKFCSECGTKVE